MKGLAARARNSNALRRVLMPLLIRFPTLLGRLLAQAQRFDKDITHPDWPAPLPAAYLDLPRPARAVLLDLARASTAASAALPARPRLAWVAPQLPDAAQGRLLAELAHVYEIDLIVLAAHPGTDATLPVHGGAWFEEHHTEFTRILYQVANTAAHGPVLDLLARHPGIVVLHDFALGDAMAAMAGGALPQARLHAHGYTGLVNDAAPAPLNRLVFDHADGMLVDAAHAAALRAQAQACYGPSGAHGMHPVANSAEAATAIEAIATTSAAARYRQALRALAAGPMPSDPRDRTLIAHAEALAASHPAWAPRQLLVDISAVVQNDIKTGIQRVVRSILLALIKDPPPGWRVEPVYASGVQRRYRYARRFTLALLGHDLPAEDDPVAYQAGDMYLGLDLSVYSTLNNEPMFASMRSRGVAIHFVVYDILPILQPDAFLSGSPRYFANYIRTAGRHADGIVCISRAVADELAGWLGDHGAPRATPLRIGYFHLGADLDASAPSTGMPADAGHVLASMAARPAFLMVGTLEPRKAHVQALAAFDLLWQGGADVTLVIVGKEGWLAGPLAAALRAHPQLGKKLFWLQGVSDQMLTAVYGRAAALLAASVGEGFGLPLIEAAQHGLPVIARNLPVFREVAGAHAFYFDGTAPAQLAAALEDWLQLFRQGLAPQSAAMPWLTWSQSAHQLADVIVEGHWYRTVAPGRLLPRPQSGGL